MAVRSTMASLISRVRLLISDPAGASQTFADQDIQDVMDESRLDLKNVALQARPTYSGSTIQYLDYYSDVGGWEDDFVLKQYLTLTVTPSLSEPIAGHWQFTLTTLPPVYLSGKLYDVYRSAADLLERWAAKVVFNYAFSSDGQSFQRQQVAPALQQLAKTYRGKQRAMTISFTRSDLNAGAANGPSLGAKPIDYFGSGDGR
jgi:hypothetical protein